MQRQVVLHRENILEGGDAFHILAKRSVDCLRFAPVKFSPTPLKVLQGDGIRIPSLVSTQQSFAIDSHQHSPFSISDLAVDSAIVESFQEV
jgi:hypothetical protein